MSDATPTTGAHRQSLRYRFWREIRGNRMAFASAIYLVFIVLVAIFGPMVYDVDPRLQSLADRLQPPSWAHPFAGRAHRWPIRTSRDSGSRSKTTHSKDSTNGATTRRDGF